MERLGGGLGGGIGDSSADDVQADTAGDQHHAALHGPENAAERRAYTAGSSVQGDGRRFQELGSGGRLDVGEQILIGGKAIEEFGVGVGLDFGQPAPPSVSTSVRMSQTSRPTARPKPAKMPKPFSTSRHISKISEAES